MKTMKNKKIVVWAFAGMSTLPILFVSFSYVFGLLFRPSHLSVQKAIDLINESTFLMVGDSASLQGTLPILVLVGGILGLIVFLATSFLRSAPTELKQSKKPNKAQMATPRKPSD